MEENDLIALVEEKQGMTISTIYGPSLVIGTETSEDGSKLIHLKEFGEEDYYIYLEDFLDLIQ